MQQMGRVLLVVGALAIARCSAGPVSPHYVHYGPRNAWLTRLLTDRVCELPCWENIVPGKSTIETALQVVQHLPGTSGIRADESGFSWLQNATDTGRIASDGSLVSYVALGIDQGEDLPLGELNQAFGYPSRVRISGCGDVGCDVEFEYDLQRMLAGTILPNTGIGPLRVSVSEYTLISDIVLCANLEGCHPKLILSEIAAVAWKGYTSYP